MLLEEMGMDDYCCEHIRKIRQDFQASQRVKDSLNNSIRALARDLYSKDTHFIFELIQNAEDNSYQKVEPSLSFRLSKTDPTGTIESCGALTIQNNEIGFSSDNVEAICAVGKTTKSKIQGYIGEKGIGFKSVFRVTSIPHIFSNGYKFCLPEREEETGLGYIVPRWIIELPSKLCHTQTTIILPLDKAGFGYAKIEGMLHDIEPESILFLSKLKEIKIETDTGDTLTILKDDSKMPLVQILAEGEKQGESFSVVDEFLLYTQSFNKPQDINQEKREGIEDREVSIAFPLNMNHEGIGKIFAYLPVRSDTGLPFLINADFILPSSREDIQDVPWNRWLMNCVAELVVRALPLLKERDLLTVDFLQMLARMLNEFAKDKGSMFYPLVVAVRKALLNEDLLPADDGSFVSARNAKLASAEWLRKLLRDEQLRLLFKTKATLKWIHGVVTEKGSRADLWKYLREELEIEEITPDSFARKLDLPFFEKQTDEWFIEFFRQLVGQKDLWKKGSTSWRDYPGPLRAKPLIRLQDGRHVKPFRDDNSPNAYLPVGINNDTSLPIVKAVLTGQEDTRRFLTELGIPELDIVVEVIEHIIPKYLSPSSPVSSEEHKRDIEKIQYAYKTDSQEKRQRLKKALQETPFILARNLVSENAAYQKPDKLYFPDDTLEMYFAGDPDVGFVSSVYQGSVLDMFKDLGVSEDVRVRKRLPDHKGFIKIYDGYGWHQRGLSGFDPEINVLGLENALSSPTLEKSAFIWNHIAIPNSACIRGTIEKSSRQTYEDSSKEESMSGFGRLLIENSWLPGPDQVFHEPCDFRLEELPESFERDDKLADLLGMKKDVVAVLAEKVGLRTEDIALIKQHPEEFAKWKDDIAIRNEKPTFPTRAVENPEPRQEKLTRQLADAPEKEYEERERSVRTSRSAIDPSLWLREQYTNENGQMVCQICKKEMPFRKRDGQYYFEAVEAFSQDQFPLEHEAQFLALCPLCAAMYKELVKKDKAAMADLRKALLNMDSLEAPLRLGDLETTIQFVETHLCDVKTILEEMGRSED
jgi:hypothetical protein